MKKIIFTVLILFVTSALFAQSGPKLPKQCEAFLPKILLDAEVLKESDANTLLKDPAWGQTLDPGAGRRKYWIVYSDREDNITYYAPDTRSKQYKQLRLSERVIIAKIEKDFALVYREPVYGRQYPSISSDAECMGWVPMKCLLLWPSCLANEHGIYNKALLCLNLDQTQARKNELGIGYTNPDRQDENSAYRVRLKTDMDFYFIMKRGDDGKVLLAKQNKLTGLTSEVLSFWVDESSYIAWSQRSCIEPTWNIPDVEYFASNGTTANIYETAVSSKAVSRVKFERNNNTGTDKYRMLPESLRYPLLDGGTKDKYKCSIFSALGGEAVNDHSKLQGAKMEQQIKSMEKLRNIRMAIVIDGTSSMEKYYPAVKQAISNACEYFAQNQYTIKISVVIYRDYTDGEGLVELCSWADADDPRITTFLDKGGNYGIKSSSSDKTTAEALYYGINYAIDNLNFDKDESNIILVVGDCGNDLNDDKCPVTNKDITDKLVKNKIHFLSFQVRNLLNNSDFANFNDQMCEILKTNLDTRFNELKHGEKARFTPTYDGFTFANESSDLLVGEHKCNTSGGEVQPTALTDLMVNSIRFCATAINAQIVAVSKGYNTDLSMFESSDKELQKLEINNAFIVDRLGADYVNIVKYLNSLMTFAGYTPKKDASGRSFYKPVVFISRDELNDLMNRLAPVDEAARRRDDNREPYLRAMKALLRSMVPDISEEEMSQMGNQEIMNLANGLNESSDALKGYTLSDMADVTKVNERQYQQILDRFQDKYRKLKGIQQTKYKFSYNFNGSQYYWIPIEDLP